MLKVLSILLLILGSCSPAPQPVRMEDSSLESVAELEENPKRAASLRIVEKGRSLLRQGRIQRSISLFLQALEVDPRNPHAYLFLGKARRHRGDCPGALPDLQKAIDLFEANSSWVAWSHLERARCLKKEGKIDRAIEEAERSIELDPRLREAAELLHELEQE